MKPKQPDFSAFYDYVSVYATSGVRTSTGGFTETQTLQLSIWADVKIKTYKEDTIEGERQFKRGIEVKCYKGLIEEANLVQYNGQMYYIDNVNTQNQAYDIAMGSVVE